MRTLTILLAAALLGPSLLGQAAKPDAILAIDNLSGTVADIADSVSAPDAFWLMAPGPNTPSDTRVGFETPASPPALYPVLQFVRVWVRKTAHSIDATASVELWENGVPIPSYTGWVTTIGGASGEEIGVYFVADALADSTGAGLECRIVGGVKTGNPANRASLEIGAVEWLIDAETVQP